MEESRLTPKDLEPLFQVQKLDDRHWLVNDTFHREFEIDLTDGFYHCNCSVNDDPPWQECEHILAVQQSELLSLENDMAEVGFKAFADSILWQIGQMEAEVERNNRSADHQISRIELWRKSENRILEKRISRKAALLRNYMIHAGKKTERLVNGQVRLRKQPPKITVTEDFDLSQSAFVRIIPEQRKPDLKAIRKHLTATGEIVPGTEVEVQPDKLSWNVYNNVIGGSNESDESALRKAG